MSRRDDAASPRSATPAVWLLVTGLFFGSGSAGLVYPVLWMRSLGLFFGSDMYGVSIILGTFMGGLALGSLRGGRLAERTTRPLLWYGLAELGIGAVALGFGAILASFDPLLRAVFRDGASGPSAAYQATRIALAGGALLVPTTLMDAEPDVPLNTDDHPYLEYFVPRDLFFTTADNVRELSRHFADPARLVVNGPVEAAAAR